MAEPQDAPSVTKSPIFPIPCSEVAVVVSFLFLNSCCLVLSTEESFVGVTYLQVSPNYGTRGVSASNLSISHPIISDLSSDLPASCRFNMMQHVLKSMKTVWIPLPSQHLSMTIPLPPLPFHSHHAPHVERRGLSFHTAPRALLTASVQRHRSALVQKHPSLV